MKFEFQLETLLKVRSQKVKILQVDLFQIQESLDQCLRCKKSLEKEIETTVKEMVQRLFRGEIKECVNYDYYLETLKNRLVELEREVVKKKEEATKKQEELRDALNQKKIVEKIKEKRHFYWHWKSNKND